MQDLQEVLHTDALSTSYRVRNVYGNGYIRNSVEVDRWIDRDDFFRCYRTNNCAWGNAGCTDFVYLYCACTATAGYGGF